MTNDHDPNLNLPTCPSCGTVLPADAPAGLCPQCLLKQGFTEDSEAVTQPEPGSERPVPGATWLNSEAASPGRGGRFVPPTPDELAAHFPQLEILELLGQGGMGAVYKARQRDLDRLIALKILPPDAGEGETFAQRFSREAKALAKLNHPNIVMVHDFGRTDAGLYFFVMEYVDGLNLRQLLHDHQLEPNEALAIVPQICEALQFAHDEGVVHRDIKPENILIDTKGRVKIADFGLAKLMETAPEEITLTREGGTMGTPQYMAPEQLEGAKHVDHRADIYSLGVVFYELLTGELPLGRFAAPSEKVQLDVRLDEVVLRTLEKEPARRYQQVSEVKTQVETIGELTPQQFDVLQRTSGREYKSKATLFGLPWLHVATGIDPKTGKHRVAKGVIAIGDVAIGGLACGGAAFGGLAFGGFAIGLLGWGGVAIGLLLATGGLALGGFAFGGVAIGGVAIGGVAIAVYSAGGLALGANVWGSGAVDPEARNFFSGWAESWPKWLAFIGVFTPIAIALMFLVQWLALRSKSATSGWENNNPPDADHDEKDQPATRGIRTILLSLAIWTVLLAALGLATVNLHKQIAPRKFYVVDTLTKTITPKSGAFPTITLKAFGETTIYGDESPEFVKRDDVQLHLVPNDDAHAADGALWVRLNRNSYRIGDNEEQWPFEQSAIDQWLAAAGVDVDKTGAREEADALFIFIKKLRDMPSNEALNTALFDVEIGTLRRNPQSYDHIVLQHWLIVGGVWLVGWLLSCLIGIRLRKRKQRARAHEVHAASTPGVAMD